MRWFKRLNVKQKIAASTFLVIVLITTIAWLSIQWVIFPNLTGEISRRGVAIAQSIANRGQPHLTAYERANLLSLIFTEKWMEPYLVYVFILDPSQDVVAHTFLKPFPQSLIKINRLPSDQVEHTRLVKTSLGSVYDTALGIYEGIHLIGTVRVGLSKALIDQVMHRLFVSLFGILVLIITIAILLTHWFSRQITRPIVQLGEVAGEVSRGDLQAYTSLRKTVECWRLKQCEQEDCPAYGRGEQPCWLLENTLCPTQEADDYSTKLERCLKCEVYTANVGDEIDQLGDVFCYMVHKLDLSQEELKQTNENLRKLNRSYMDMLSFVSHELKTPIANSSMSAQALLQGIFGDLTPTQKNMVGLISRNLDQSVEMAKNYLDLSRIEKDELHFQPAALRLKSEVLESVLADLATIIDANRMRVEDGVGEDVALEADAELLRVVYTNLVGNACKYGREGGVVRLEATDQGSTYRLEVWNEGEGVPQEKMNQLFQKFSRVHQPARGAPKGTGLGLFITRTIVERHGGKIWVEGREGEWIDFIMELPKLQERSQAYESKEDSNN